MLIIGHRGAAGIAQENTLESLRAGIKAGADMIEFDVRVTSDNVPVLAHGPRIGHKWIKRSTLDDIRSVSPVTTLDDALTGLFGRILLNIEIKRTADAAIIYNTVAARVKHTDKWESILFSSFRPQALGVIRARDKQPNLALLHHVNPFAFVHHDRRLNLAAVGFHRLYVNTIALAAAKKMKLFTYAYTVNRPEAAKRLDQKGIDGIVTDYPDKMKPLV